jgi:hypothetical protein
MIICKTCGSGAPKRSLDAVRPRKPRVSTSKPPRQISNSAKAKLYAAKFLQRYEKIE